MSANLITALNMMWQGMLGLFIVMALIALIVFGMSKFNK
ncbi:MAG: sodium pump decarboxylase gamma subunit [Eubacteriales bacterium]|nr:sodium pump decarboxylase gamma subunit [Eubacteriales bacterium]